jgi:muramidase (phage lysozyme)
MRLFGVIAASAAALFVAARYAADAAAKTASESGDGATVLDYANPFGAIERQVDSYQASQAMQDANVIAFLSMIAYSEGTDRAADPYRVTYGYRYTIKSLSDHPAVTGEWRGERLPDAVCSAAGYGPGCVSTAAGRYQLIRPTWLACKRALGLQDFSPDSQDAAAVYLIRQRGALDHVKAGRIGEAVAACRQEWASLPGAGYGQPERRLAGLVDAFRGAGGVLA